MNQPVPVIQTVVAETGFVVKLINFLLFQSVWLITVLGAARGLT